MVGSDRGRQGRRARFREFLAATTGLTGRVWVLQGRPVAARRCDRRRSPVGVIAPKREPRRSDREGQAAVSVFAKDSSISMTSGGKAEAGAERKPLSARQEGPSMMMGPSTTSLCRANSNRADGTSALHIRFRATRPGGRTSRPPLDGAVWDGPSPFTFFLSVHPLHPAVQTFIIARSGRAGPLGPRKRARIKRKWRGEPPRPT